MGANVETPAMQMISAVATATHHHATVRITTRNDEMDAFPIALLYDK
jgi:hypothetical protein